MRYLEVGLLALTAVSAVLWYVLWILDGPPHVRRRIAVLGVVAFGATVIAHQVKVSSSPPEGAEIIGRP